MPEARILLVEDDDDQRRLVASILRAEGYVVTPVATVEEARGELGRTSYDLVLSDWKLPDGNGLLVLTQVRKDHPQTAFIVVTAYGTISHAVEAVREGADDYLAKPFESQALLLAIEKALRTRRLANENRRLVEALDERDRLVELVGKAPSMQKLYRRVSKIAGTDATVLLTGESGTGKELAARALHALSRRTSGPFVPVNCAAVPEGLLESEFFGVEKGAYTGADRSRTGKWESAHEGTLFLDEVGELPLSIQPKLLRALQEGRIQKVGGAGELAVDVRIIAATNRELGAEITAGRFREDLYYRLNVVPLHMPPLRERREDIPLLVEHFTERAARRHRIQITPFSRTVMKQLMDYAWPGNVRELANVVERLILLSEESTVQLEDLPDAIAGRPANESTFRLPPGGLSWESHEKDCLRQALELSSGNRARAARLLDMPYKAFLYRLEKHELE